MKRFIKILLILILMCVSFFAGIMYAFPKKVTDKKIEEKYSILQGYRNYSNKEVTLPQRYSGSPLLCPDDSKPQWFLYSGFGNSVYAKGIMSIGGSFDGYFYSVRIMDCGDNYFVLEKHGDEKYFGPFNK